MQGKDILINITAIGIIAILPHAELIPNFGYTIPIILFIWLCLKYFGEKFSDIGFSFKSFKIKAVAIGFLSAVFILSFMQIVFFPVLENFMQLEETNIGLYDFVKESKWNFLFIVIMGWIVGGFYEEIVFHGFIFTRLEKMIAGKHATIFSFVITSIIFGLYHIQMGPLGVINAFIVGMVYLSLLLFFKRNLWYSIICHGFYNTIVLTLIYLGYL